MSFWACAQLETNRTAVALHFLKLGGFETYCPRFREQRRQHGRKIITMPPLFPDYTFVMILAGWWNARWSPGVVRLRSKSTPIWLANGPRRQVVRARARILRRAFRSRACAAAAWLCAGLDPGALLDAARPRCHGA